MRSDQDARIRRVPATSERTCAGAAGAPIPKLRSRAPGVPRNGAASSRDRRGKFRIIDALPGEFVPKAQQWNSARRAIGVQSSEHNGVRVLQCFRCCRGYSRRRVAPDL